MRTTSASEVIVSLAKPSARATLRPSSIAAFRRAARRRPMPATMRKRDGSMRDNSMVEPHSSINALADTNALLHNIVREGDPSFVFEKIGTNIHHVMIDEFQDTSRMQWSNFKLLLLEGLSQGADSLIVGDVKQSIYRWRSGDWSILNGLKGKIGPFPINEKTLTTNRRSEANIVKFNNEIFTAAINILNDKHRQEQGKDCEELKYAYQDVTQEICRKEAKGSVKLTFLSAKDDIDYQEDTLEQLANEVESMVQQGVKVSDMAKHNTQAPDSGMYLIYCNCKHQASGQTMTIVAAMTVGDIRNLKVGKNALFYDRQGRDWEAEVVKIVDNPISIGQASRISGVNPSDVAVLSVYLKKGYNKDE